MASPSGAIDCRWCGSAARTRWVGRGGRASAQRRADEHFTAGAIRGTQGAPGARAAHPWWGAACVRTKVGLKLSSGLEMQEPGVFVELLALTDSDGGGVVREIDKDVGRTMPLKMFFGGDGLADYSSHFGREKELETIRNVIRHASTSFSRHNVLRGTSYSTPVGSQSQRTRSTERSWRSLSRSSSRSSSARHPVTYDDPGQKKLGESSSGTTSSVTTVSDGIHRITLSPPRDRGPRVHGVVVVGPAG